MREILFRGKRLANGEWYYGSYIFLHISSVDWTGAKMGKLEDVHYIVNDQDINYAVYPSTIGQYTGLKDKNGKRIFEGDILRWTGEDGETGKVIVIFAGGSFLLKCVEVLDAPADPFDEFDRGCQTLEVIGNIHDNPELLEGGDEG